MQITASSKETCSHSRTQVAVLYGKYRQRVISKCLNCKEIVSAKDMEPTIMNTRSFAQIAAALEDIFDLESVERWNRAYAQMAGWYDDDRMESARRESLKFVTDNVRKRNP